VGASDLADPTFAARSPITHAAQIRAPVLLLQGADDKVNPPEQSLELARRIIDAGGRCDVHLFAGEAHGFKRLDTLRTCLELEQRFLDALA
jgi:dipeptidyl aminopeptidase/acylaminoacyl peptidase